MWHLVFLLVFQSAGQTGTPRNTWNTSKNKGRGEGVRAHGMEYLLLSVAARSRQTNAVRPSLSHSSYKRFLKVLPP